YEDVARITVAGCDRIVTHPPNNSPMPTPNAAAIRSSDSTVGLARDNSIADTRAWVTRARAASSACESLRSRRSRTALRASVSLVRERPRPIPILKQAGRAGGNIL